MPTVARLAVLLVLALSSIPSIALAADEAPPAGFVALFNGTDLTGWYGLGHTDPRDLAKLSPQAKTGKRQADSDAFKAHWRIEDGALVNDGNGPYATTEREYGDIELTLDYKTVAKADSGIYLRGTPQVQIWDTTEAGGKWSLGANKGSGGLWNNSPGAPGKDPLVKADRPFGEWNTLRIVQAGEITSVWLNETLVVDHARMENFWDRSMPLAARGPIQLQTHGGEIRWRHVYVRELPVAEATRFLREKDGANFTEIFNGRDFTGWKGPVDEYEVVDGALRCRPGKGGTIYTEREYGDFTARLEFRLPPGGNNGLAIRYPGEGDAAYAGMCELQVLDDGAPKYATLDPRQYHGSIYGMVPSHRGYQRPVGEWNYEQVTVRGSHVVVELNGTRIIDADVSTVTSFMANSPHPGKDRTRGHFGFAGHDDPVEFRAVSIREER
jgi:3-keto-disaccharide hydrolase